MFEAQKIIDAVSDGIYIVDKEGYVVLANKTWLSHINMPPERIIGRHVTDALREYYFSVQCLDEGDPDWVMRDKDREWRG